MLYTHTQKVASVFIVMHGISPSLSVKYELQITAAATKLVYNIHQIKTVARSDMIPDGHYKPSAEELEHPL